MILKPWYLFFAAKFKHVTLRMCHVLHTWKRVHVLHMNVAFHIVFWRFVFEVWIDWNKISYMSSSCMSFVVQLSLALFYFFFYEMGKEALRHSLVILFAALPSYYFSKQLWLRIRVTVAASPFSSLLSSLDCIAFVRILLSHSHIY